MSLPPTPIELRLMRCRILYRHWMRSDSEVCEGYVREFAPDGSYCRVTRTPKLRDVGFWLKCADYRCVDVLEQGVDFAALEKKERERRRRERDQETPGEEWKEGDGEDGD